MIEFGKPPAWAYPTLGGLQDTGTPLPERIRVKVWGRADRRIDIDEMLTLNEDETHAQIVEAALSQAGDYVIEDFVETYVTIIDGRANVVGYVVREECFSEEFDTWNDEDDEAILDAFIAARRIDAFEYEAFDLYLQRL